MAFDDDDDDHDGSHNTIIAAFESTETGVILRMDEVWTNGNAEGKKQASCG